MSGVKKSQSAQRLMDVARKNLTWHSYSGILEMIGQVVRGKMVTHLRSKDILAAVEMLAQSTEERK